MPPAYWRKSSDQERKSSPSSTVREASDGSPRAHWDVLILKTGLYGGHGPDGAVGFRATEGVLLSNLPRLGKTKLLTDSELEYYATEYDRHGLHGPLNWYRTREINYLDELRAFFGGVDGESSKKAPRVGQEVLFVMAKRDSALLPQLSAKMEERIPRLTRREVDAGHWALWERAEECNAILKDWYDRVVFKNGGSKL